MKNVEKERNVWLLLVVLGVFALSGVASADLYFAPVVDDQWLNAGNWYDTSDWSLAGRVPTLTDNVPLENEPVISGPGAEAALLWIAPWGADTGSLTVEGSLHTSGYLWVGSQGAGELTMNSGVIDVDDHLILGANSSATGQMYMNGGVVNTLVGGFFIGGDGTGHLEVAGGTINTSYIGFGCWGSGSGTINFSGDGEIISDANQVDEVQGWIDNGWITNAQVNFVGGKTVISQIPEPATLTLLGLGAVAMLRRKR
ncbi:MAG: hypothetical protein DRJ64_05700 [Thermoprotei archaeon]|nr:MAG: hypothetical protein DRJ64_05700 [Thermoprotei archaeon]